MMLNAHRYFRSGFLLFAIALTAAATANSASAADKYPPAPARYFNDYASITSPQTQQTLNDKLEQFQKNTSSQVVVAIFPKLNSTSSVDDYSIHLFQAWKIGQKGKDNGVGLFVYVQSHQMFIVTGYGMEGALPDATCKQIIETVIKPKFKAGDYDGGLTDGVNAILAATRGEFHANPPKRDFGDTFPPWIIPVGFFLLVIFLQFLLRRSTTYGRSGRGSGWWIGPLMNLGGGFGGGFGGGGFGGGGFGGGGGFSGGGGSTGGGGAGGSW